MSDSDRANDLVVGVPRDGGGRAIVFRNIGFGFAQSSSTPFGIVTGLAGEQLGTGLASGRFDGSRSTQLLASAPFTYDGNIRYTGAM